jgi:hypothetical protein
MQVTLDVFRAAFASARSWMGFYAHPGNGATESGNRPSMLMVRFGGVPNGERIGPVHPGVAGEGVRSDAWSISL